MNLSRQTSGYAICMLLVLIFSFIVSCGRSGQPEETAQGTPAPSGEPQVEYGASLSEWEEAVQANSGQSANNDDVRGGETQPISPLAAPASASPLANPEEMAADVGIPFTWDNVTYREILWDGLIPMDFTATAIMAKYQEQLAAMEDGSPEANDLFAKMQDEFNNAPVNEAIDEALIRLPGFIAPLEYTDDLITEFLLVPYFGACIHTPPPPANQTVLVKTAEGQGIKVEESYNPIWVMGKVTAEATTTQLAAAGYYMQEAIIEPYTNPE